ncbi:MAG: bifunctional metallophosphatase/5'-nucleotidase [Clostridia bacterium]|nr:bifunctional metallophosphatase/5'-nucleotidase [Clostridia bacterium]
MKKTVFSVILCLVLALHIMPLSVYATQNTEDIIILYENDVHCAVEGYSKISAMKKELQQNYAHVGVVSVGDYVQGSSLGAVSKGEYIVNLMNLVGYDAVTLGNHEFDYRLSRLNELVDIMNTKPVCCNFQRIGEEKSYFEPYSIVSYGDVDIAYIGITTPSTISSSFPGQFKDDDGNYIFTFNPNTLYDVVQSSIDSAKQAGADVIVALSHIGYEEESLYSDIEDLIENTSGLDVVLDGHSHSVIESMKLTDEGGNEVVLTSTGTKFEHIGKLTVSDGNIKTELIKTEEYDNTDSGIDDYIAKINNEYAQLGERKIGVSEVDLITHDENGNRLVRLGETNLGDFCADAFRFVTGADIGYINGGGLRSMMESGEVTFNDVLNVFPFNNQVVVAKVSGQVVKDMLEMSILNLPAEEGSFPHMSGITFSVNMAIPHSVIIDENEQFNGVSGEYRVYDIKVFNRENGKYEPIDLNKEYTFASHNYCILEHGSGMKMFEGAQIVQNDGMLDVEMLEKYIVENLNGTIGKQYENMSPNITFTQGFNAEPPQTGDSNIMLITAITLITASIAILFFLPDTKKR